ncbi:MAG TPA: type IV secretion system protein [Acetobacteraceae bacterium]|nr:type IV secretion system protein [Acetobacteraceae bacterium]
MGEDFISAQALFAGSNGPVATDFHIFAALYTALFTPFQTAVQGVIGALLPLMAAAITAGVGAVLIAWALTIAIGAESAGAVLNRMITRVLLPAAVVLFLLSGVASYQQWLVTWISQLPDDIGRAVTGGLGGAAVNSGDPFDNVWNKAYVAGATVFTNLPFSLKGAVLALVVILYWIAAAAAVLLAFAMFVTSKVLLQLLIAVSPVFVGAGAFQPSRFLLRGFAAGIAGVITAQVLVVALLGIAFNVENQLLAPVLASAANANVAGLIASLLITGCVLGACAVLAVKIPAIAIGLTGGVFDGMAPWVAAGGMVVRAAAAGVRGAVGLSSGTNSGTAGRQAIAGRSLSGRP